MLVAGTTLGKAFCFSLVCWYPPPMPAVVRPSPVEAATIIPMSPHSHVSILRAPIEMAQNQDELQSIAATALGHGSKEADVARVTEAFQLYRNSRVRIETVEACIKDSTDVLGVYWGIRQWMLAGMVEKAEFEAVNTKIVCLP